MYSKSYFTRDHFIKFLTSDYIQCPSPATSCCPVPHSGAAVSDHQHHQGGCEAVVLCVACCEVWGVRCEAVKEMFEVALDESTLCGAAAGGGGAAQEIQETH